MSFIAPPPIIFVPDFNSANYLNTSNSVSLAYLIANYLPLTGGSISGNLFINGILSLNTSGLTIGGVSVSATAAQLNYLSGVTAGTAAASKALVLDASSNITNINSLTSSQLSSSIVNAGAYLLSGSSINLSALSGVTAGTASASKALIVDSSINIAGIGSISQTVAAGGNMLTLTSSATTARNTILFVTDNQSWEIGSRGSTASNPTNFYIYNGAYKLLMNPTGDTSILSTTDTTSSSTGCLKLSGGLGVVKNVYVTGMLTLDRNGSNLNFVNGSNSGLIELPASPNVLRVVNGYAINVGSAGVRIGSSTTAAASYPLDMGSSAADIILNLYGGNYTLGANNSSLILNSGGGGGIKCYYSTVSGTLGTNVCTIQANGNVLAKYSFIGGSGGFSSYGYDTQDRSSYGMGMHVFYDSGQSKARMFCYNYSNSTYGQISIQNDYLCVTSSGQVNIGAVYPNATTFPLYVQTAQNYNITGPYGFLSNSGAGSSSGSTGSQGFSLYCAARMACSEVDCFSDIRLKENIRNVSDEEASIFLEKVKPKWFSWKKSGENCYGYIAQDILKADFSDGKHLFQDLISQLPCEGLDETIDEDGFMSPKDKNFNVSYTKVIPLLHQALLMQKDQIETAKAVSLALQASLEDLKKRIIDIEKANSL